MNASEIVKALQKETGTTQKTLASMTGMKNQTNVSEALKRDMKISVFYKFINAMGYEIVIKKKPDDDSGSYFKLEL